MDIDGADETTTTTIQNIKRFDERDRWHDITRLTNFPSKMAADGFTPGQETFNCIQQCRVLVVGAGGLGCEMLKDLALSGFQQIDVIDMDRIELTNLNRQFLFRMIDIGKPKAEVAAAFINKRVPGCTVIPHFCNIKDMRAEFYQQFHIIICGLDSVEARLWLNETVCNLTELDLDGRPEFCVPLIDGGTEGFKGHCRVVIPFQKACLECTTDLYPPQVTYPVCTLAENPRLPEHCVEYVKMIQWMDEHPFDGSLLDPDDPIHVNWVLDKARQRAKEKGMNWILERLDFRFTQGVLKHIVPAVATTNAVIAGCCVLEAVKLASLISPHLNGAMMNFNQTVGAHFGVAPLERNEECPVCSGNVLGVKTSRRSTLQELRQLIAHELNSRKSTYFALSYNSLVDPSLQSANHGFLLNSRMGHLERNLSKRLEELDIADNDQLLVADDALRRKAVTVRVQYLDIQSTTT